MKLSPALSHLQHLHKFIQNFSEMVEMVLGEGEKKGGREGRWGEIPVNLGIVLANLV